MTEGIQLTDPVRPLEHSGKVRVRWLCRVYDAPEARCEDYCLQCLVFLVGLGRFHAPVLQSHRSGSMASSTAYITAGIAAKYLVSDLPIDVCPDKL